MSFGLSASILGPWLVSRPDIIYVYSPPLTVSIPAAVLKLILRCPIVIDIQDLWPDALGSTGMVTNSQIIKVVGWWAKAFYSIADQIVVLSPGFRERLIGRGVPAAKVHVVYNWNEESRQKSSDRDLGFEEHWGLRNRLNIMYAGSMGPAQALDSVLDAAAICLSSCPVAQFVFVGGGLDLGRLKERAQLEKLENVRFIPQQSMQAMSSILPLASALLVQLKEDPLFEITIPSKIQAYLACGRPIIIAARGNAAALVIAADAGLVIAPESPADLIRAVKRIASMSDDERATLGSNGQRFYKKELSMAVGVAKFEAVFNEARSSRSHNSGPAHSQKDDNNRDVAAPKGPSKESAFYLKYGKRAFDLIVVIPALILLSPVFLVISLFSAYDLGLPITFKQLRAGKGGKLFYIRKFRSMTSECDAQGELLPDAVRTSKYGAFLRRASLDELPGLINVLLGEMSLVGPRPLLPEYIPYYSSHHARRHDVLPGITGPAQINGRQLSTFSARMEKDVWYVDHVSFITDLRLILETIPKVIGSKGVVTGQDVREVDDLGLSRESRERFQQSVG